MLLFRRKSKYLDVFHSAEIEQYFGVFSKDLLAEVEQKVLKLLLGSLVGLGHLGLKQLSVGWEKPWN